MGRPISASPLVSSEGLCGRCCLTLFSSHAQSPSPPHDDGAHAVLVATGEKMLVGDGLGPEYSWDSSKVLGVEGGQLVEVACSHPPAF